MSSKPDFQKMVFSVANAQRAKLVKENPNLTFGDASKKAWKTKEVLDARKKYEDQKAKYAASPAAKKTVAKKKPAAKKPAKKGGVDGGAAKKKKKPAKKGGVDGGAAKKKKKPAAKKTAKKAPKKKPAKKAPKKKTATKKRKPTKK